MRARIAAIVLTLFMAALAALAGAGTASAANQAPSAAGAAFAAPAAADEAGPQEAIKGTMAVRGADRTRTPIPGVAVTVSQDGTEIGTATSDDEGAWLIEVPGSGTYQATIDVTTLPPDVQLRDASKDTLPEVKVQAGSAATVNFLLESATAVDGEVASTGTSRTSYIFTQLLSGLRFGLIIAMTAIGLSLVFGTTGLINFAHGELVAIGAVLAFVFGTAPLEWPFLIAIALAIIGVAALAGLIETNVWRPLRKRGVGLIQMFIISIGLSLLLRHAILLFFGSSRVKYAQATTQTPIQLGPATTNARDLVLIGISLAVLIGVSVMLQTTRMGKAMRALADNQDLAEASGINVQRVILQVWLLGGGLAALGGVFYGLTAAVYWDMGFNLLLMMFAGIILGGLGSAYGAMVGSIVIGILAQMSTVWFASELKNAWALLILIAVLLIRPQGILGRLQRAG